MIMMSGEEGSASFSHSQINMTQMLANRHMPLISPSNYTPGPHNVTKSSIGNNVFATQQMIDLHHIHS